MIMTLIIVIDRENKKKYCAYEHSNWHHLKILSKIIKYAQTAMFGTRMYKGDPSCKEIMDIMEKNSNCGLGFEEFRDFRKFNSLDKYSMDGFIIFEKTGDTYNDIFINTSSKELDRGTILKEFRHTLMELSK